MKINKTEIAEIRLRANKFVTQENVRYKLLRNKAAEILNNVPKKVNLKNPKRCIKTSSKSQVKLVHSVRSVPKELLDNALKYLHKDKKKKGVIENSKYCSKSNKELLPEHTTFITVCSEIKKAIVSHDWLTMVQWLIILIDAPKQFRPIKWKAAFLAMLYSPAAKEYGAMERFLQLCVECENKDEMTLFLKKTLSLQEVLKIRASYLKDLS